VTSPDSWAALVGRFPLDVSYSRRHDWWRVTGLSGRWLIPDYQAVAAEYDGIHVSAAAYLSTAGRAVAVRDGHTMLAGWDPDETFWLADVLEITGSPQVWEGDGQDAGAWHPSERQWLRGEPGGERRPAPDIRVIAGQRARPQRPAELAGQRQWHRERPPPGGCAPGPS
jgi:hypothetical protein